MDWLKVCIKADRQDEEILTGVFLSAGADGVQTEGYEEDHRNISEWDWTDGAPVSGVPFSVCAYYPCDGAEQQAVSEVKRALARAGLEAEVLVKTVREADWENNWKAYFKPMRITQRIVIKPTWEQYAPESGDIVVELDPGMAFGTGTHETTRLCLRLLEKYMAPGMTVADVGCGSGVLSIAAAKLGAAKVYAMDIDSVAIGVAQENVKQNGCESAIDTFRSDGLAHMPEGIKTDMVVANIIADIIISLTPDVPERLLPGGVFLCSGIIDNRLDDVLKALEKEGFAVVEILEEGEWRGIVARQGETG